MAIQKKIRNKLIFNFLFSFVFLVGVFMLTAGTLRYWQGWVLCLVMFIPVLFNLVYFLNKSPEFLERRMKYKEEEMEQKAIIKVATLLFFIGLLFPGFDYRFGWSYVPDWLVLVSDALILLGFVIIFLTFRENAFAGRTVEVFKDQKVIDTGPYAVVRHPMYCGVITIFVLLPIALGSYWGLLFFIPMVPIIFLRILEEEKFLRKNLSGYVKYCEKVRYRLIPYIW